MLSITTHRAEPSVASVRDELRQPRLELRAAAARPGLLHAGRAVDQDDRRIGPAAAGQAQPAARPAAG